MATVAAVIPRAGYSAGKAIVAPVRSLDLYNIHTTEHLGVTYFRDGQYDAKALEAVNYVLRDYRTDEIRPIEPPLLDLLFALSRQIDTPGPYHIISGYRSRATNEMFRRRGRKVSKNSLHIWGKAVDIRVPGFSTAFLRRAAVALQAGGVGYYPQDNFVHVDVGRVRCW